MPVSIVMYFVEGKKFDRILISFNCFSVYTCTQLHDCITKPFESHSAFSVVAAQVFRMALM